MRKNILTSSIVLSLIVVLSACGAKKAIVKAPSVSTVDTVANKRAENIRLIKSKDVNFRTLSFKGKAKLIVNRNVNDVSMNVRIQRDQKIWISFTALAGIEIARVLITPDSILLRNNFQSTYLAKPFSFIQSFSNKRVDFKMLQSIIAGNTINDFTVEPTTLDVTNGLLNLNGARENLRFSVLYNTLFKASEVNLNDVKSDQALQVNYGEYQQLNASLFPSTLKIRSMSGRERILIELSYSKVESNLSMDFPFTVPKRYKLID